MWPQNTTGTIWETSNPTSFIQEHTANQALYTGGIASTSKRSLSPVPEPVPEPVPPRKKTRTKTGSQKGKERCVTVELEEENRNRGYSQVPEVGPSTRPPSTTEPAGDRSALKWVFVNNARDYPTSDREDAHSDTSVPRAWTNSREGFFTMFPQLAKNPVGFSWFQSETPILLLDTNYALGDWINSTTLNIDLLWDFSCYDSELEPVFESDAGDSPQLPSAVYFPENTLDREAEMMDLQRSYLPRPELFPIPVPVSTSTFDARTLPLDDTPRYELYTHESQARGSSPFLLYPSDPPSPERPQGPSTYPIPDGSFIRHTTPDINVQPRIPFDKPPEVETFLNSQLKVVPLLLWMSGDSDLVPCDLPPEYVYLCMGFFFISDLYYEVVEQEVYRDTGVVQGRVCWNITLQWVPGGEDTLFDGDTTPLSGMALGSTPCGTIRDLSHPWWFQTADELSAANDIAGFRPREPRAQSFSCIPLDFLGEFQPSEVFPRGWFCKSCGMINTQKFFRHQICQSTKCGSTREKRVPEGKVSSLSSLRDPYQSSVLIRPMNNVPPTVVTDQVTWDDDMQTWIYGIKDGVTLFHVFTGNEAHHQEDATALLERIQREALLRKEDRSSPYFIHTTRIIHPTDGSGTKVPSGTPDCVRMAYYTLCDFVHRYTEMGIPRFGEVRLQACVNSGTRRGNVFCARKSPVVVHCLGVEVILNLTPKGGYKDVAGSTALDKGKGRAQDESPFAESCAGPSCELQQACGGQAPSVAGPDATEYPIDVDAPAAAMIHDAGAPPITDSNMSHLVPGTEEAHHDLEVAKAKQGLGVKKNKVVKDKGKMTSLTLVHGDAVVLYGDDFECQIVRFGTTILVIGFPDET